MKMFRHRFIKFASLTGLLLFTVKANAAKIGIFDCMYGHHYSMTKAVDFMKSQNVSQFIGNFSSSHEEDTSELENTLELIAKGSHFQKEQIHIIPPADSKSEQNEVTIRK